LLESYLICHPPSLHNTKVHLVKSTLPPKSIGLHSNNCVFDQSTQSHFFTSLLFIHFYYTHHNFSSSPNLPFTEHTSNSLLNVAHFAQLSLLSAKHDLTASNCDRHELWIPLYTPAEQLSTASLSVVMCPGWILRRFNSVKREYASAQHKLNA
jgi:hypothetical protein